SRAAASRYGPASPSDPAATATQSRASRQRARGRPDSRCAHWARPAILFSSNPRRERPLVSSQRPIPRLLHQKETSKIVCSPPNRCRKETNEIGSLHARREALLGI